MTAVDVPGGDDVDGVLPEGGAAAGMTSGDVLKLAMEWINDGFPSFPVALSWNEDKGSIDKRPLCRHGHLDATLDMEELARLVDAARLRSGEVLAVGNVPGAAGYVILDCDVKNGSPGLETLERLKAVYGEFDRCLYRTPSGGRNIFLRKPPGMTIGNHRPEGWDGIDVRSDSGWVVAVGTWSPWGRWQEEYGELDDVEVIPEGMAALLREAHKAKPSATVGEARAWLESIRGATTPVVAEMLRERLDQLRRCDRGSRHTTLMSTLGFIAGMDHLDHAAAFVEVTEAWNEITAGEGREQEPFDGLLWVIPQEMGKREDEAAAVATITSASRLALVEGSTGGASRAAEVPEEPEPSPFVDWAELWNDDIGGEDWLDEGVLARGRGHVIFAGPKAGKSLLMLERSAVLVTTRTHVDVLYLDYEMTRADLRERLVDMGYGPETDLSRLHYASLPLLPPLDTREGAEALLGLIEELNLPDGQELVVVIDTFSRAAEGKENDNDTTRNFYRHTGAMLKRRGVTYARLDHIRKVRSKGQRGNSAKNDDVDVVWRLQTSGECTTLVCELGRMGWLPDKVVFKRTADPLRYHRAAKPWSAGAAALAATLDRLGVPLDASIRTATDALRAESGTGRRREDVSEALKFRRAGTTRTAPPGTPPGTGGETPPLTRTGTPAEPSGTAPEVPREPFPP